MLTSSREWDGWHPPTTWAWEREWRLWAKAAGLCKLIHRVVMRLTLGGVGASNGIDDALRSFLGKFYLWLAVYSIHLPLAACQLCALTLIVVDNISEVISATVMRFPHAHRIVSEVDIAVIAEDYLGSQQNSRRRTRSWSTHISA
jgi:hypothetical protein